MLRSVLVSSLAAAAAIALPLATGGCSMMGDTGSASNVSRDSQGAGAISGAVSPQGGTNVGTPGNRNPPSN